MTVAEQTTAPTLVFAWGNPSRGDDALGPRFAEAVQSWQLPGVECLTDFQLQVEHALDLVGRERVLFVDATVDATMEVSGAPFTVTPLHPRRDASFTSHALSPQAVLQAFADTQTQSPPPAWLLSLPGAAWGLGEPVSATAEHALHAALTWARPWLAGEAAHPGMPAHGVVVPEGPPAGR